MDCAKCNRNTIHASISRLELIDEKHRKKCVASFQSIFVHQGSQCTQGHLKAEVDRAGQMINEGVLIGFAIL